MFKPIGGLAVSFPNLMWRRSSAQRRRLPETGRSKVLYIVRTGGAVLVSLEVAGGLGGHHAGHAVLPLGGDHLIQIGIVFGATFVACEVRALLGEIFAHFGSRPESAAPEPRSLTGRAAGAVRRALRKDKP
jgi:hypothetical protein